MVMFNRLYFPLIALFWIIMNLLLWRAEFGGGKEFGSAVPTEAVWQKILSRKRVIGRAAPSPAYCGPGRR